MAKAGYKKQKMEERLKDDLNMIIRREISNPHLQFVSVTKVELSPEYSWAKVYWDTFDASKRGTIKKALESSRGMFRSSLAKGLKIRFTPEILFEYDSQYEDENHIDQLLKGDSEEDPT